MASRAAFNISLTPQLEKFVVSKVRSGRYQSPSEVVREGLRLMEERDLQRKALGSIREQITTGWKESERGELKDGEAVFNQLIRRFSQKPRKFSRK